MRDVRRLWVTAILAVVVLGRPAPAAAQADEIQVYDRGLLYGVINRTANPVDVEVGVGFGLTDAADGFTLKLILARDLNRR